MLHYTSFTLLNLYSNIDILCLVFQTVFLLMLFATYLWACGRFLTMRTCWNMMTQCRNPIQFLNNCNIFLPMTSCNEMKRVIHIWNYLPQWSNWLYFMFKIVHPFFLECKNSYICQHVLERWCWSTFQFHNYTSNSLFAWTGSYWDANSLRHHIVNAVAICNKIIVSWCPLLL